MEYEKFTSIEEVEDMFGISIVETTIGNNGYPHNLKRVLSGFDNVSQCLHIKDILIGQGHTVEEYLLHKRDGWDLWGRKDAYISKGMFKGADDSDWYVDIHIDYNAYEVAFSIIYHDVIFSSYKEMRELNFQVQDMGELLEMILDDIEGDGMEEARVFYNPDQHYRIEYVFSDETAGYSYDTNSYEIALGVTFNVNEDED